MVAGAGNPFGCTSRVPWKVFSARELQADAQYTEKREIEHGRSTIEVGLGVKLARVHNFSLFCLRTLGSNLCIRARLPIGKNIM